MLARFSLSICFTLLRDRVKNGGIVNYFVSVLDSQKPNTVSDYSLMLYRSF